MYILTEVGRKKVESFIRECEAKRKEILDAKIDTANDTELPTVEDIVADLNDIDLDIDIDGSAEYYNGWGVTDNYDSDYPLSLELGIDFVKEEM